jgi:hypothetical protein
MSVRMSLGVCVAAVVLAFSGEAVSAIVNYENDPALAKAMEYDAEMNGGDPNKADRAMAEKYYLEYLQKPRESFQQAHVYAQLGALYAVAVNPKRGEKPDYAKASVYLRKVLEAEPTKLGDSTIRARSLMSSMGAGGLDKIKGTGELYVFLAGVDANAVSRNWLPRYPGDVPGQEVANICADARGMQGIICRNLKYFAQGVATSALEPVLRDMATRAPGTDLAHAANDILRERGLAVVESGVAQVAPAASAAKAQPKAIAEDSAAADRDSIVPLDDEMRERPHLVESVVWPAFDFSDVRGCVAEPNKPMQDAFVTMVRQVIDANNLPDDLGGKVVFLKGWRGQGSENCIIQYDKGPYRIRVRNQKTVVHASRDWESFWLTVAIDRKDGLTCIAVAEPNAIMAFADRFLTRQVSTKAQDYSNVIGQNKPVAYRVNAGWDVNYMVGASEPRIDGVSLWSNGQVVTINLKERRKILFKVD